MSLAQAFARRVMRAGLLMRVTAASCGAPVVRMPACRGLLPLADVPDRERHGPTQLAAHMVTQRRGST